MQQNVKYECIKYKSIHATHKNVKPSKLSESVCVEAVRVLMSTMQ